MLQSHPQWKSRRQIIIPRLQCHGPHRPDETFRPRLSSSRGCHHTPRPAQWTWTTCCCRPCIVLTHSTSARLGCAALASLTINLPDDAVLFGRSCIVNQRTRNCITIRQSIAGRRKKRWTKEVMVMTKSSIQPYRQDVRFSLTIDPSVSTLDSTSLSCAVHLIFMALASQTLLSSKCVRKKCASHPHGSGAVIRIHSARSGVAENPRESPSSNPLESPSSRTANRSRRTPRVQLILRTQSRRYVTATSRSEQQLVATPAQTASKHE